jgi:hypothetical protein
VARSRPFWIGWLDASATEVDDWRADRLESGGVCVTALCANDRDRLAGEHSDRRLVAELANIHGGYALTVSRLDGSRVRTLAHRAPCPDLIEGDMQWLPDSRSLVYDLRC